MGQVRKLMLKYEYFCSQYGYIFGHAQEQLIPKADEIGVAEIER